VGSAVARALERRGWRPVILDAMAGGRRRAPAGVPILRARCGDARRVAAFARRHGARSAVHCAASCLVGESMQRPELYYRNNMIESLALLEALRGAGVRRLIFSSSAAVYGEPQRIPIPEDHPLRPVSPYGETKAAFERALEWHCRAHGLTAVALRFFNAAGADASGAHGEDHDPETHLIPRVLAHALSGRGAVEIYGTDYPTPDGTAVRDYVHVDDLAEAHVLALERCGRPGRFSAFNLGTGHGASVREVLRTAERASGRTLKIRERPRRAGDPAFLVASNDKAREELGWRPGRDLQQIVDSAWGWHRSHPRGYATRLAGPRSAVLRSARGVRGA
jgi:UDP-glucose-4-epimerase GalE